MKAIWLMSIINMVYGTCTSGTDAFQLQCKPNMTMEVTVDLPCFHQYYPNRAIDELYFNNQNAQCPMCVGASCNQRTQYIANGNDLQLNLFADCVDSALAPIPCLSFNTIFGIPPGDIQTGGIVGPFELSCTYCEVDGVRVPINNIIPEAIDAKGFNDTSGNGTIGADQVEFNVTAKLDNGHIIVGTRTQMEVTNVGNLTNGFYIDECTSWSINRTRDLQFIEDGCPLSGGIIDQINLSKIRGAVYEFDMFAFIDQVAGIMILTNDMECVIKMGASPNCGLGGRKRRSGDEGIIVYKEFSVGASDEMVTSNGVAYAKPDEADNNNGVSQIVSTAILGPLFFLI